MNIFLANVGNRDIAYNFAGDTNSPGFIRFEKKMDFWNEVADELDFKGLGMRLATEKLNQHFEKYKEKLTAPILFPSLNFILNEFDNIKQIDSLILFVTDNPKKNWNWNWDTIEAGKLLEKLILEDKVFAEKIKNIQIIEAKDVKQKNINPSNYDEAYKFILRKTDELLPGDDHNVFTALSGGIPAMNSALRSYIIERFGFRAFLIQNEEPSENEKELGVEGKAELISSWTFRKTILLRLIKGFLERYDYQAVLEIIESEKINDKILVSLCSHGKARLNFDFEGAEGFLRGLNLSDNHQRVLQSSTSSHTSLQRITEIAFIARILLERKDLIAFLALTACFRELVVDLTISILGISLPTNHESFGKKLEKVKEEKKKLNQSKKKTVVIKILKDIEWKTNLNKLCELRNDILHHGRGVNISDIEEILPNSKKEFPKLTSDIIDNLLELYYLSYNTYAQIDEPKNIYALLNEMIIKLFDKFKPKANKFLTTSQ